MSRPKAFDPDTALDAAIGVFLEKGYEAASIGDLVEATGVNRASLYGTFGDKHGLFLAALERYRHTVLDGRIAVLRGKGSPRARIERYFEALNRQLLGEGWRLGCLITNTAIETAPLDPRAEAAVIVASADVEAAFVAAVAEGQALGEIGDARPARDIARFLANAAEGLKVTARGAPDRSVLESVTKVVLSVLD